MNINKIYAIESKKDSTINNGKSYFLIIVTAINSEVARQYVKDKIGIDKEPTWLMNAWYPTIYTQSGNGTEPIQAKILYNGNCHFH